MIGYRQFVEQSKEELRAAADAAFKKHGSSFSKGGAHQKPTYGHSNIKVSAGKPENDHDHGGGVAMRSRTIRRDHTKNLPAEFYGKKGYGNEGHTGRPGDKPGRGSPTPTPPANAPRADLHRYRSRAMGEESINELSKGLLGRYINQATRGVGHHAYMSSGHAEKYMASKDPKVRQKHQDLHTQHYDKRMRRSRGIARAVHRLAFKEEHLDELVGKGRAARFIDDSARASWKRSLGASKSKIRHNGDAAYWNNVKRGASLHKALKAYPGTMERKRQLAASQAYRRERNESLQELLGKGHLDDLRTRYHTRAVRARAWAQNDPGRKHYANDNVDTQTDQKKLERATALKKWRDSSHDRQFQRARARKYAHEEKDLQELVGKGQAATHVQQQEGGGGSSWK